VENKGQLDSTDCPLNMFWHHYANHQELKNYTDGFSEHYPATRTHKTYSPTPQKTTGKPQSHIPQAATICIILELLMMAKLVPEKR
jgi:hypothetical protein